MLSNESRSIQIRNVLFKETQKYIYIYFMYYVNRKVELLLLIIRNA